MYWQSEQKLQHDQVFARRSELSMSEEHMGEIVVTICCSQRQPDILPNHAARTGLLILRVTERWWSAFFMRRMRDVYTVVYERESGESLERRRETGWSYES